MAHRTPHKPQPATTGGGRLLAFVRDPPPPVEVGRRPPRGVGGGHLRGGVQGAAMGGEGCYVGNGKNFRAPSASPYVWPAAIDPW